MDAFNCFIYLCIMKNNALQGAIVCLTLFVQTIFAQNNTHSPLKEQSKTTATLKKDTMLKKTMPSHIAAVPIVTLSKSGKIIPLSPNVSLPKTAPATVPPQVVLTKTTGTKIVQTKERPQEIAPPKAIPIKPSSTKGTATKMSSNNALLASIGSPKQIITTTTLPPKPIATATTILTTKSGKRINNALRPQRGFEAFGVRR